MTDPAVQAQTLATIEQAHAAWAQVWVGALSASATFAAVIAALGIPALQWWRQRSFKEDSLLHAAQVIISLHETLETKLLAFSPWGGVSVIRIARQRLEHTIPIVHEYRMITFMLALAPMPAQTEKELERWTQHMAGQGNFSPDSFRLGMKEQAEKARAILKAYGSRRLTRKLSKTAVAFT